ncbi:glycosyl transferase [Segatella asaccharophila]
MKKKLLVFHSTIAPYRVDLFNDLSHAFDATICFSTKFKVFKDTSKIDKLLEYSPVYLVHKKKNIYQAESSEYVRMLKETNPDVVLTAEMGVNTIITLLYRWIHRKHYKVVSMCDDSYDMIANNNDHSLRHRIVRRVVTPYLDNLILVEPKVVDWYQNHYHKGVWFPIIRDEDKARKNYERLIPESQELVNKYRLAGKHVFLYVGRLVALKNVKTIIQAFKELNDNNSVLVIIGSGEEEGNLHKEAEAANNIIFTGRLEDDNLYKWYNVATAFILASYQESFGAVTNEALLAGCWAIVSRRAGSQCLVMPGVNGDVFSPTDTDELCQKMKEICKLLPALPDYLSLKPNAMIYGYRELLGNLVETLMLSENSLSDKCT